jgi:transcriptional regulator with XRE-family HTH domain
MSADPNSIGARLRSERKARRLSVDALAEALRDHASERDRRSMPRLQDLRRMIRGYESGEHVPGPRNRMLYAAVFDMAEEDLFGDNGGARRTAWRAPRVELTGRLTADDEERLTFAVGKPARLDTRVAESLSAILAAQRRTEDTIGSAAMVEAATTHLRLILRLLKEARERV